MPTDTPALPETVPVLTAHTPEPWGIEQTPCTNWIGPLRPDGKVARIVCDTDREGLRPDALERNDADARRIAACVNACKGISTEAIELVAAMTQDALRLAALSGVAMRESDELMGLPIDSAAAALRLREIMKAKGK